MYVDTGLGGNVVSMCSCKLSEKARIVSERTVVPKCTESLTLSQVEAGVWEDTDYSRCCKCRHALFRLEKLKANYDVLKDDLKTEVRMGSRQQWFCF